MGVWFSVGGSSVRMNRNQRIKRGAFWDWLENTFDWMMGKADDLTDDLADGWKRGNICILDICTSH